MTLQVNTIGGLAWHAQGMSGPPWYTTWDRPAARRSVRTLAELRPTVVAGGHGWPLTGPDVAEDLDGLAAAGGPLRSMSGELVVDRPVEEVFDMAADEPSWNPAMTSVEWLTPPPFGPGSRFVATMGGRLPMQVQVTGFDRPRSMSTRTHSPMMTTVGTLSFRPSGTGTLMRWHWRYRLHGPARLTAPAFAAFGGRWERSNWKRMRDLLEARPR